MNYRLRDIAKDILAGKVVLSEDDLAQERLKVCQSCDAYRKMLKQCSVCGCIVTLKVKLIRASCPVEKW